MNKGGGGQGGLTLTESQKWTLIPTGDQIGPYYYPLESPWGAESPKGLLFK